jgi:hypothetical protein
LSEHTAIIKARDLDGTFKDSKIWFVNAQNVEDARKVLSFEVTLVQIAVLSVEKKEVKALLS